MSFKWNYRFKPRSEHVHAICDRSYLEPVNRATAAREFRVFHAALHSLNSAYRESVSINAWRYTPLNILFPVYAHCCDFVFCTIYLHVFFTTFTWTKVIHVHLCLFLHSPLIWFISLPTFLDTLSLLLPSKELKLKLFKPFTAESSAARLITLTYHPLEVFHIFTY